MKILAFAGDSGKNRGAAADSKFPETGSAMSSCRFQRAAITGTALLIGLIAPNWMPVKAADPPPSAHETALLDRIFANWKTRHDRIRSLHVVWDCRTTYKKGSLDFTSTNTPRPRLKEDRVFEQFGAQLWVQGDDRMCLALTRSFKVPEATLTDTDRVVIRHVIVDKTAATFTAGSPWDTGVPAPSIPPRGTVIPSTPDYDIVRTDLAPLFAFRAQTPFLPWSKREFRVVDENATFDNVPAIELRRSVEKSGPNNPKDEEFYWVSPARDDAVVHWIVKRPPVLPTEGAIKYKKDANYGWLPSEWTFAVGGAFEECALTQFSANGKIDPAIFAHPFPPGTPVMEATLLKQAFYVAQEDGSKRAISEVEFRRLTRVPGHAMPAATQKRPEK
jgi:hypothetical protein